MRAPSAPRGQHQLRKLIAGPAAVAICNDCVELATSAMRRGAAESDPRTTIAPLAAGSCSFCGLAAGRGPEPVELMTGDGTSTVCGECLSLCHNILAEELAH